MRYFVLIASAFLVGCATQQPRQAVLASPTDPKDIVVVERLTRDTQRIGVVEGLSCDTGFRYVEEGKYEAALDQAKRKAAALGATGIAGVRTFGPKSAFSCATRGGVRVRATAFRAMDF